MVFLAKRIIDPKELSDRTLLGVKRVEGSEVGQNALDKSVRKLYLVGPKSLLTNVTVE